jgi:hypothetical protein
VGKESDNAQLYSHLASARRDVNRPIPLAAYLGNGERWDIKRRRVGSAVFPVLHSAEQ